MRTDLNAAAAPTLPPALAAQGAALLAGVRREPGADAPRLVYADFLEEYGGEAGAARAELIRLQVELAAGPPGLRCSKITRCHDSVIDAELAPGERPPADGERVRIACLAGVTRPDGTVAGEHWAVAEGTYSARASVGGMRLLNATPVRIWCEALRRREKELLDGHALEWSDPLMEAGAAPACTKFGENEYGYGGVRWSFRRGFVGRLSLPADLWSERSAALTAAAPLEEVRLTSWPTVQVNNLGHQTYPPGMNCRFRLADGRGHDEGGGWRHGRMRDMDAGTPGYEAAVLPLFAERWPGIKFSLPQGT